MSGCGPEMLDIVFLGFLCLVAYGVGLFRLQQWVRNDKFLPAQHHLSVVSERIACTFSTPILRLAPLLTVIRSKLNGFNTISVT